MNTLSRWTRRSHCRQARKRRKSRGQNSGWFESD